MERDFKEKTKQSLISEIKDEMAQINTYVVNTLDGWNDCIAPKMASELRSMGVPVQDDVPSREIGQVVSEIYDEEKRRIEKIETIWENVNSLDTKYAGKFALLQEEANVLTQQIRQINTLLSVNALGTFEQLPEYFNRICSNIDSSITNSGFLAQVQLERNKMQNPDKTYNWEYVKELMNAGKKITRAQLTALSELYFDLKSPEDMEEYIKCGYAWVTEKNKESGDVTYSIEMTSVMQAVVVLATETASMAAELTVFDPRIPVSDNKQNEISEAFARTTVLQHLLEYQSKIPVASDYFVVAETLKGYDPSIGYDYPVQIEKNDDEKYTITYTKEYPFRYDVTKDGPFGIVKKHTTEAVCYGLLNSNALDGADVEEAHKVTEYFRPNTNWGNYAVNETAGWILENFGGKAIEIVLVTFGVATGAGLVAGIAYTGGKAVISYAGQLSSDRALNSYLDQVNSGFALRFGVKLLDGSLTYSSINGGMAYFKPHFPSRNYYLRTQGFLNNHAGMSSDELKNIIFNNSTYGLGDDKRHEKAIEAVKNDKNLSDKEKQTKTKQMEYEYGVYKEYVDYYENEGYDDFKRDLRKKYEGQHRDLSESELDAKFEELTYNELLALSRR